MDPLNELERNPRRELSGLLKLAFREAEDTVSNPSYEHVTDTTSSASSPSPEPQDVMQTINDMDRMQINDVICPIDKMTETEIAYDKASNTLQ
jgi:hypothetical protein